MNLRGFRIRTALVIFVVIVVLGIGLQNLHQKTQVINPLVRQLQAVPGVDEVTLTQGAFRNRSRAVVNLNIRAEVPLALAFGGVHHTLQGAGGDFAIQLEDSADEELWRLFQQIQVATEEAIMTGEFTVLEERVQNLAEAQDAAWELALDRDYIYLRLTSGENMLQRVISRGTEEGKIIIYSQGVVVNG